MSDFSDFYGDPSDIIQEMAHALAYYYQQLQNGEISSDEYNDLVSDATTLNDVAAAGKTIGELALLDKAIAALKEIASAIPFP